MHSMGKTINELHAMLKLHEQTLPKNNVPTLHAIRAGHWKRNCPQYLAELLKNKKLSQGASGSGALSLYVGNGQRAEVEAIGSYHLSLPSGLVIVLNNCHCAPSITRGVISDGIFEIDLSDSYTNVNYIYALSNKRSKSNLDSTLLWHCRLGHISKKHIEKLQHDGLLNSTGLRDFENAFLVCLERWQEKLTHIKWKEPKTYLD
ncbi:zinc finger, CCHC-type containing protein [Tanacetum coccineum]|uniref:Zinc finger, CCHC-type containing protein n=1 Tax=Tanacetum coccineum TaxID=301880 RepID=A0ABQ4Z3Z1_9ASTR